MWGRPRQSTGTADPGSVVGAIDAPISISKLLLTFFDYSKMPDMDIHFEILINSSLIPS